MNKTLSWICIGFVLIFVSLFVWNIPANASPNPQLTPFPTPTPGADGRILYTVQAGDTLWRIAAVAEMTLDEIRQLNSLSPDQVIFDGQVLLLGIADPGEAQVPAAGASEADPAIQPVPTPVELTVENSAIICVFLYEDMNGDALRQESELSIAGGEASVTERTGLFSEKRSTEAGDQAICFGDQYDDVIDLPPGNYIVTMAIPDGYNETTKLSVDFELSPGDITYLNFGAQNTSLIQLNDPDDPKSGRSALLGILGVIFILASIGVGIYSIRIARKH